MKTAYVALLRGINVGSKNRISMPKLIDIFTQAGAEKVSAFIQSGNILFSASKDEVEKIREKALAGIEKELGKPIPVVVRSASEMKHVLAQNPLLKDEVDPKRLFVMFLEDAPTEDQLSKLDPERSPGDKYVVEGKNLFMDLGNGAADSKLTNAYFDSKLKTVSTSRNWQTTNEITRLLEEL